MALSKQKKQEVVSEIADLLSSSKMTIFARYSGTSVQQMQVLRSEAAQNGTKIRVVKNRLFKKALDTTNPSGGIDAGLLTGQLIYAFNDLDEVAPAQCLANFSKSNHQLEFVGGISNGTLLSPDELKYLASLPSKEALRTQFVGVISAPMRNLASTVSANLSSLTTVLKAREESLN